MVPNDPTKPRQYDGYWGKEEVELALEKGQAFKGTLTVSQYDRADSYVNLRGVTVMIKGVKF